jgi:hypothetical protein
VADKLGMEYYSVLQRAYQIRKRGTRLKNIKSKGGPKKGSKQKQPKKMYGWTYDRRQKVWTKGQWLAKKVTSHIWELWKLKSRKKPGRLENYKWVSDHEALTEIIATLFSER